MKYRLFARKVNLAKHSLCQDNSNLSKQIINEQILNDWSGLSKEAQDICDELELSGLLDPQVDKKHFKASVRKACKHKNEDNLIEQIKSYKKMSALRDECVKGNEYFYKETLYNVRTLYKFRVDMIEAKMNFKNNREYKSENFLCDSCESATDQNSHVLFCPSYSLLREGKNINNDQDLAEYLQKVLEIRMELRLNR